MKSLGDCAMLGHQLTETDDEIEYAVKAYVASP